MLDLNKVHKYNKKISILEKELKLKRKEIDMINITYGEIKSKIINSLTEEKALKIIELEKELEDIKEKRDNAIVEVRDIINKLEDYELRKLMELRYVDCLKWGDIAEIMGYSERHTRRMYKKALKNLQ